MSENVTHQMMMLRPMHAGLSGYARLQGEPGRQLMQINLRGLSGGEMRVFWYAGEGLVREVGRCAANPRGEAALSAEVPADTAAPRRLMALLITDGGDRPKPLAIGLCTAQSAGSLMDAKNALLALCDKLGREASCQQVKSGQDAASVDQDTGAVHSAGRASEASAKEKRGKASVPAREHSTPAKKPDNSVAIDSPAASQATRQAKAHTHQYAPADDLPREVFLPAIEARRRPERRRYRRDGSAEDGARAVSLSAVQQEKSSAAKAENGSENLPYQPSQKPWQQPSHQLSQELSQQPSHQRSQKPSQQPLPTCAPAPTATASLPQPQKPMHSPTGLPADRLPTLQWPAPFQSLAAHFDHNLPQQLMNWPGWRFVHVQESRLWIGYRQQDGCVRQVAYALPSDAQPPAGQPFRFTQTISGEQVQLLVLDA